MTSLSIYEYNNTTDVFDLKYEADNCERIIINKSTGIIPIGLPIVDTTKDTTGRIIPEKTDLIRISGVECTLNMTFDINPSDIITMLDLVTNAIGKKNKIAINGWSDALGTDINFIGLIGSIDLDHHGGNSFLSCRLVFYEGDNILFDMEF